MSRPVLDPDLAAAPAALKRADLEPRVLTVTQAAAAGPQATADGRSGKQATLGNLDGGEAA